MSATGVMRPSDVKATSQDLPARGEGGRSLERIAQSSKAVLIEPTLPFDADAAIDCRR